MEQTVKQSDDIFIIQPTAISPLVILDKTKASLIIKGNSILEDSKPFYNRVFRELENYLKHFQIGKFRVDIHFVYLNTQALKEVIDLINILEKSKINVLLNWYYSDDEVAELGSQLCEIANIKMQKFYAPTPKFEFDEKNAAKA